MPEPVKAEADGGLSLARVRRRLRDRPFSRVVDLGIGLLMLALSALGYLHAANVPGLDPITIWPFWIWATIFTLIGLLLWPLLRRRAVLLVGFAVLTGLLLSEEPWFVLRSAWHSRDAAVRAAAQEGELLRVITLNTQGGDRRAIGDAITLEPDVILLSERLERSRSWTAANEQWAASESTLLRTRLTETGWGLGPVFTPNAPACLDCLYSRIDANRAGGRLFTHTVGTNPPHARAYVDTVTELLFRTLLGQVPRYLDEQFVVYDHYDQDVRTPRVFALPHCEVCDV